MCSASIMSYPGYVQAPAAPITMLNVSLLNQKDSRWLQLEVCREYQRQKETNKQRSCQSTEGFLNPEHLFETDLLFPL